jgi:hypothetical protein
MQDPWSANTASPPCKSIGIRGFREQLATRIRAVLGTRVSTLIHNYAKYCVPQRRGRNLTVSYKTQSFPPLFYGVVY